MTSGWAPYLDPGERILWEGQPAKGLRFRTSDLLLSGFGVIFLSFSLFWVFMASFAVGDGGGFLGLIFPLFGLPFVAVGVYLVFGRFIWDAYVRSRTRYALTDKRAIVATSAFGRSLKSWPITGETRLEFEPGDEATIWFHEEERRGNKGRRYTVKKGFEYVASGDELYRLMRSVQQDNSA
ncbi:MAG: aspartate carbamoyltransferase catalytic subunit [Pseudomonadota bacterium]